MSLIYNGQPVDVGIFPSVNSLMNRLRETKPLFTPNDFEPDVIEHYSYKDSWYGCKSKKRFDDMTLYGSDNTKAIRELKEATTNPVCINKMRRGRKLWSDCGDDADVSRYFMGEWDCMSYRPLESMPSRSIKVFVPVSVPAWVGTDDMIRAGTILVRKLCALSLEGYGIRLEAGRMAKWACSFRDPEFSGKVYPYSVLDVLIKGEEDDFDPARIAFALMEPIFSRGLGFSYASRTRPEYGGNMSTCDQRESEDLARLTLGDGYTVIPLFELCKVASNTYGQKAEQAIEDYIDRCLQGTLGKDDADALRRAPMDRKASGLPNPWAIRSMIWETGERLRAGDGPTDRPAYRYPTNTLPIPYQFGRAYTNTTMIRHLYITYLYTFKHIETA